MVAITVVVFRTQPSSGGCVLKQCLQRLGVISEDPAVFGRLCVETSKSHFPFFITPPAVFGRLCVETPYGSSVSCRMSQPSSGGCVLKQVRQSWIFHARKPAAFGRLCVETFPFFLPVLIFPPAAFGRLCVETIWSSIYWRSEWSAAFGRLCVETTLYRGIKTNSRTSRLRAAVC